MSEKRTQRSYVAAALAEKPIREAVSKLVRSKLAHPGPSADALNHPPQRLRTSWRLRVLALAPSLVLRNPKLDLNREYVVIEFGLHMLKTPAQDLNDVRR